MRFDVSVEKSVDLNHVKAARKNFKWMLFAVLHSRRIEDAFPVLVRPAAVPMRICEVGSRNSLTQMQQDRRNYCFLANGPGVCRHDFTRAAKSSYHWRLPAAVGVAFRAAPIGRIVSCTAPWPDPVAPFRIQWARACELVEAVLSDQTCLWNNYRVGGVAGADRLRS